VESPDWTGVAVSVGGRPVSVTVSYVRRRRYVPEDPSSKSKPNPTTDSESEAQPVISSYLWGAFYRFSLGRLYIELSDGFFGFSGLRRARHGNCLPSTPSHPSCRACVYLYLSSEVDEWFRLWVWRKSLGIPVSVAWVRYIYRRYVYHQTNAGNYTYFWVLLLTFWTL